MGFSHVTVLLKETTEGLNLRPNSTVVDATVGGGGHAQEILERIPGGKLVCIDKDISAIEHSKTKLTNANRGQDTELIFMHSDFVKIADILEENNIQKVDAIVADLGVSSHQIDTVERGFSYMNDAELDMRMDVSQTKTAHHVVNLYKPEELFRITRDFGEERYAKRITEAIVKNRPVKTTLQLSEIIKDAVPGNYYKTGGHPAKRTFQAIRIEVNGELEIIEKFIVDSVEKLEKGGRIAIITFHSLEDRIVKQTFKHLERQCICPPRTPICICQNKASLKIITKKPIEPSEEEIKNNSRSGSAKLRIAEKV